MATEPGAKAADLVGRRPADRAELARWVSAVLGVEVADRPMIHGHSAPLDYLCWTFFEGGAERPHSLDAVVWANRGGGKTFLGALATLLDLVFKPTIEIRILGGSMDQSRRMHAHLRRFLNPRQHPELADLADAKLTDRRLVLANGSEVELLAQSQASVRGTRVQKLRCDEVELFDLDVWEAAQLVTRSKRCTGDGMDVEVRGAVECLSTMHRPHGLMHKVIEEARRGKRRLFRWGVADVLGPCADGRACGVEEGDGFRATCPLWGECRGRAKARAHGHISIDDAIGMKSRVSLATWEAEMLCLRPRRTDAVLPEFEVGLHLREVEPAEGAALVAGMDFGYRAPTAVLWAWHDPAGVLWIVDERVEAGMVLDDHLGAIREGRGRRVGWGVPEWIGVDPAGRAVSEQTGLSPVQVMRKAGLAVRDRRLSVEEGLGLIRARLKPACGGVRLMVHPRCTTLIESLERYHYRPEDPADERPVKDGSDHAVDALRYLVLNLDRPPRVVEGNYLVG
ncbi:MAG: hypothetical protein FJ255_08865 [Phycisphaerae bacterium]|nr:hypothetical protein [Phycisphaerae bacterium]